MCDLGGCCWGCCCGGGVRFCSCFGVSTCLGLLDSLSERLSWSCGNLWGSTKELDGGTIPPPRSKLNWASTSSLICDINVVFKFSFHWFRNVFPVGVFIGSEGIGVGWRGVCRLGRNIDDFSDADGVDVGPGYEHANQMRCKINNQKRKKSHLRSLVSSCLVNGASLTLLALF